MTKPSQSSGQLTGVWFGPAGTRTDITHTPSGWQATVALTRSGRLRVRDRVTFTTEADVRDAIARLQATGWVPSGHAPSVVPIRLTPTPRSARRRWSLSTIIGALLLLAVLITIATL